MKRSVAREIAVQLSYSYYNNTLPLDELIDDFFDKEHYSTLADEDELFAEYPDAKQEDYIRSLLRKVCDNQPSLDGMVEKYSRNWKTERLSGTSLNILRCAIAEILYFEDIPVSVSINEAVELAKKYDSEETASFVNGILGSIVKELNNTDS